MSSSQQSREGFLKPLRRVICRLLCYDEPSPPPPPPAKRLRTFEPGKVYNLNADAIIADHSDICHNEVAFALLRAVVA